MLRDDVDDAFVGVDEIAQAVFGIVEAAGIAHYEHGWVVVDYLEIAEGGEVGALPLRHGVLAGRI